MPELSLTDAATGKSTPDGFESKGEIDASPAVDFVIQNGELKNTSEKRKE